MEDWEEDCIQANNKDRVKEEKLLKKYGGLHFVDGRETFTINKSKLYVSKIAKDDKRYVVHAMKSSYDPEDVCDCEYENFHINEDLHGLLYQYYYHNPDPKIRILTPPDSTDGNGKWLTWLPDQQEETRSQRPSRSQVKKKKTRDRRSR
jgi:hypothetical protein